MHPMKIKLYIGNEFGIFCCIIITRFYYLTNNFNKINDSKFAGITAIMPIMAAMVWLSEILGKRSFTDSVSKVMKLCDYDGAIYSKFIAYSFIFIECIVFIQ